MEQNREQHSFDGYMPPVEQGKTEQSELPIPIEARQGARIEQKGEHHTPVMQATPVPVQAIQLPTPVVAAPDDTTQQSSAIDDNPIVAGDVDLIEKEWVDKAKKIIAVTKGRPYEQAKAIALLQADYLKKRHNRELGGGV